MDAADGKAVITYARVMMTKISVGDPGPAADTTEESRRLGGFTRAGRRDLCPRCRRYGPEVPERCAEWAAS